MSREQLSEGFIDLMRSTYEPEAYFDRVDDLYISRRCYHNGGTVRSQHMTFTGTRRIWLMDVVKLFPQCKRAFRVQSVWMPQMIFFQYHCSFLQIEAVFGGVIRSICTWCLLMSGLLLKFGYSASRSI
jgi:hypothetical protein